MPLLSAKDLMNGWSPSKLASLNFFLNGTGSTGAAAAGPSQPPQAAAPFVQWNRPTETFRPYQGLKALLRAGPGGLVSGPIANGLSAGPEGASGSGTSSMPVPSPVAAAAGGYGPSGRPGYGQAGSMRYNPYGRPK